LPHDITGQLLFYAPDNFNINTRKEFPYTVKTG